MTTETNGTSKPTIFTVTVFGIAALVLGFVLGVKYASPGTATSESVKIEQAIVTKKLDSIAAIAKSASDSAASWKSLAQTLDSQVNALIGDLAVATRNRKRVSFVIDSLPDSALVRRYYIGLYQ
jgi:hypothetical protein